LNDQRSFFNYCNKIYSIEQQIKIDNLNRVLPNNKQERVRILEKVIGISKYHLEHVDTVLYYLLLIQNPFMQICIIYHWLIQICFNEKCFLRD